jgi:hypothetical protein
MALVLLAFADLRFTVSVCGRIYSGLYIHTMRITLLFALLITHCLVDLTVNLSDFSLFRASFGTPGPDADFNGDGQVNLSDFSIFRSYFGRPPGPSCVDLPGGCVP